MMIASRSVAMPHSFARSGKLPQIRSSARCGSSGKDFSCMMHFARRASRAEMKQASGEMQGAQACTFQESRVGSLSMRRGVAARRFRLKLLGDECNSESKYEMPGQEHLSGDRCYRQILGKNQIDRPRGLISKLAQDMFRFKSMGKFQAVLATAATTLLIGLFMFNKREPLREEPQLIHPQLSAIQTRISDSSRADSPYEHATRKQKKPGSCPNLNMSMLDMTVQRAPAYKCPLQVPNPRNWNCWVSDQARVLSRAAVEHLNSVIDALKYDTGTEITVVTMEAIDGSSKISAKDFAASLYDTWKIDYESQGRGLLLLVVTSERMLEVETGWNMSKLLKGDGLWESEAGCSWIQSFVKRKVRPKLKRGDYDEGIISVVERAAERVWEAAGLPGSRVEESLWKRIRLVDLAWLLLVPMLGLVGRRRLSLGFDGEPRRNEIVDLATSDPPIFSGNRWIINDATSLPKFVSFSHSSHYLLNRDPYLLKRDESSSGSGIDFQRQVKRNDNVAVTKNCGFIGGFPSLNKGLDFNSGTSFGFDASPAVSKRRQIT